MKLWFWACCVAVGLSAALASSARAQLSGDVDFKDGDRVAFIGNTFVEREGELGYLQTMFISRHPDRNLSFRNLGYSADTATGAARGLCTGWSQFEKADAGFARLRKLVAQYKPTVLLINYGMTESFNGPAGLDDFTTNYNHMLDDLSAAAGTMPRLILMTPSYHEDLGRPLPDPSEHNKNLELYSKAIADIAAMRKAGLIHLFAITRGMSKASPLTFNGIHLTKEGYWRVACELDRLMDLPAPGKTDPSKRDWEMKIEPAGAAAVQPGDKIERLTVTADALPLPPEPVMKAGAAAGCGARRVVTLKGLTPGNYQLSDGKEVVAHGDEAAWSAGVALSGGPDVEQAEALRKLIVAKDFDYFNYQRPDNDSYILAFRKGEQGRNAPEIPEFLPLVEEKEKQISLLRVPRPIHYTLEKTK